MFDFLYICSYSCIRGSLSISIGHSQLLLETTSGEFARRFITFGDLSGICYGGEQLETRPRYTKKTKKNRTGRQLRRLQTMSTTETLRTRLDALQVEHNVVVAENSKLRGANPEGAALPTSNRRWPKRRERTFSWRRG